MDESPQTVAAVDLGSNSFHLIVAQVNDQGILQKVDKIKEMVRLRGGLDDDMYLSSEKEQEALACLQRFGERIRHLPANSVRIAGTNTLRNMKRSSHFLRKAKVALGHSVEIIAGQEEARLVYLGVAHTLSDDDGKRLVVDIGGGSTELIIGAKFQPKQLESLEMGSVSATQKFFPKGNLDKKYWKKANTALCLEITPNQNAFKQGQWKIATGSSGTIKAAKNIILALGLEKFGITLHALHSIRDLLIEAKHIDQIDLPSLKADRAPVFAGGLAILIAVFETLKINQMTVSEGALREGLLYDLIGRIHHEDIRVKTIADLQERFSIDPVQSGQVTETAIHLADQVGAKWSLQPKQKQLLIWAATLHELGLNISHHGYQHHGSYILQHADLPGFSRKDQHWLSCLVGIHRRKIDPIIFEAFSESEQSSIKKLSILLRLSVLLHRSRKPESVHPQISIDQGVLNLTNISIDSRPMLLADLQREQSWIKVLGFQYTEELIANGDN
ncbi:MAG TPA: Ppx/GppA family phosphatase [Thiotrichaceae bacterium]|nr:Ppx/GppA family phosphatase [Thiotrichaceae bacterium]